MHLWEKFKNGLSKTRQGVWRQVRSLFNSEINDEFFAELEEMLIQADVGFNTTMAVIERLKEESRAKKSEEMAVIFRDVLLDLLPQAKLDWTKGKLKTFLFIGVNGSGKTTTCAKFGYHFKNSGAKVLLAAGDTYRAAAIEQLLTWGQRLDIPVVTQEQGTDPASVAFDAKEAAVARKMDMLLVDTAGRLHTEKSLMAELQKVKRVLSRDDGKVVTLLVLDATNGQNALEQGRTFNEGLNIDGLIMTKLDGTAKGGILFAITRELGLPVFMVGLGERPEDLREFSREAFVDNLLGAD